MSAGDWKDMFKGVQAGNIELVGYYLKIGVDPNHQHPEFMAAALVESIRYNHLHIAKLLLEKGADPHIKEAWAGDTPLSVASSTNNEEAMLLLNRYINKQ